MTPRRAAVTGATGFLGRQVVKVLADQGWTVRVLSRRDPIEPLWRGVELEVVPGDLGDSRALDAVCDDAQVVIHAAGLVKARDRATFDAVNAAGARMVAMAALRADTPHVVLVSSLSAREPGLSHYAASKRAGELAMAEVLVDRLSIIRPCAIYGPGDRELLPVFQAAARSPLLPVPDDAARVAMIHVEDAAHQTAAVAAAQPTGRTHALCDSRLDGYSWRELMAAAAIACDAAPRLAPVPRALLQAVGITNDFTMLLGRTAMLSSAKVRELLHRDWSVSADERYPALPSPRFTLMDGFADTVAWYRTAAWMKH
ncbi:MAG: SDR family NAD(P)-dependent oxidoreductase [Phenylobacterium sp.]|nr:SDR family NAD(P)-dependent oxidoreductase [Phenylobacterium sp.]